MTNQTTQQSQLERQMDMRRRAHAALQAGENQLADDILELLGSTPATTAKQDAAIEEFLADIKRWHGEDLHRHNLVIGFEPEYRRGRGHDVRVHWADGDGLAWAYIDVYGNGHRGWGHVTINHASGDDDCACGEPIGHPY